MKNIYFILDIIMRQCGVSEYKILGKTFDLNYSSSYGYILVKKNGSVVKKEKIEDIYIEMIYLSLNSVITSIVIDGHLIDYISLDSILQYLNQNLVLCYEEATIYYIDGKYIRLLKNFETGETEKVYMNNYYALVSNIGSTIRYVSLYKDISLDEFIKLQGENAQIINCK